MAHTSNWLTTQATSGTSFHFVTTAIASMVKCFGSTGLWSAQQIPKIFFGNPSQTSLIVATIGDALLKTDSPIRCQPRGPWASLHSRLKGAGKKLMSKTVQKGRDAKTGRYISIEEANRRPSTTVVEKVKVGPTKHRNK